MKGKFAKVRQKLEDPEICWKLSFIAIGDESQPCVYDAIINIAVTINSG